MNHSHLDESMELPEQALEQLVGGATWEGVDRRLSSFTAAPTGNPRSLLGEEPVYYP